LYPGFILKMSKILMNRARITLAFVLAIVLGGCGGVRPAASLVPIKLIAINDFHGHLAAPDGVVVLTDERGKPASVPLGGAAYLATLSSRLAAENPRHVIVGAGDLISASPLESALFHDETTVRALDAIGLEWTSVGNHEFDRGAENLLRIQNGGCAKDGVPGETTCLDGGYGGAHYRYLAANVLDSRTGKPLFPAYGIKQFQTPAGQISIAFIGLVLKSTPDLVIRKGITGLTFADEADTVNSLLPELHAKGINAVIVLIHQGGESSGGYNDHRCPDFRGDIVDVVNRLDPAVSAIISAHTHNAYICQLESRVAGRSILVTSAGKYGQFVTDLDLQIDPATDHIVSMNANNLPVVNDRSGNTAPERYPALAANPAVAAIVDAASARVGPLADAVAGWLQADLYAQTDLAGESSLGEVIADAQLEATLASDSGGAQIAFVNETGVRADLRRKVPGYTVNYGQLYTAQPFKNYLVTMTLTGAQLRSLLEAQWQSNQRRNMLQPSRSFSYAWRASAPQGQRIDPASMRLRGEPIQADGHYRVTVNNFLANGGDGFTTFRDGVEVHELELTDLEALQRYLKHWSPVPAPEPGRIVRRD